MVVPGIRQDYEGKAYQIVIEDDGKQTRKEIEVPYLPFQIRFLKADGGHLWNFASKDDISVSFCFRQSSGCKVCGTGRTHNFKVLTS